jgi:4'-phosphopantetheinyl transferase
MTGFIPLPLAPTEVHLWYLFFDRVSAADPLDRYLAILSPDERARQQRFLFAKDRRQFLLSHALVRTVLSQYAAVPPAAWDFKAGRHGKPYITAPLGLPPLSFNLSHTHGLAAVVVALDREIGVDAEWFDRSNASFDLAERFFAADEVEHLRRVPAGDFRQEFFAFWTLKEAYLKACGLGLAVPLADFAFHLEAGRPPRITFSERLPDDPDRWQFVPFRPQPTHGIAVAIRRPPGADLAVVARHFVPQVDLHPI